MVSKVVTALKHSYIPADNSYPSFICAAVVLHILLFLFCLKDISFADYLKPYTLPDMQTIIVAQQDAKLSLKTAWQYFEHNDYKNAVNIFTQLMSFPETEGEAKYGLALSLMKLGRLNEALELANKHQDNEKFISLAKDLRLQILRKRLSEVKSDSPEAEETAKEILSLEPEDRGAFSILVWRYLNTERHDMAYELFLKLYKTYPDDIDYAYGLALSMMKQGRFNEALELAEKHKDDKKLSALKREIRLQILWNKFSNISSDSPELKDIAIEILSLKSDEDGLRETLAWWYYNNKQYEKAYEEFYILYEHNPITKGYAFGLVNSLINLNRLDEAAGIAKKNKEYDERLSSMARDIYLDKANAAYENKKYNEAEIYFHNALEENPEDIKTKELLYLSRYKQTMYVRALSLIEGLPGYTWGTINYDMSGNTGTGSAFLVNQGIAWVKLPGELIFNTFAEYRYRTRTRAKLYFDESAQVIGLELKKLPIWFGAEYSSENYIEQDKTAIIKRAYFSWFHDWYKYVKKRYEDRWMKMEAFSGSTYGRITHDLDNLTGTGILGFINQGIDWFTFNGDITFNTYAEYWFNFRTKDSLWYNSNTPGMGMKLQKIPFEFGMDYFQKFYTEQNLTDTIWTVYLRWYYGWELKPVDL